MHTTASPLDPRVSRLATQQQAIESASLPHDAAMAQVDAMLEEMRHAAR